MEWTSRNQAASSQVQDPVDQTETWVTFQGAEEAWKLPRSTGTRFLFPAFTLAEG